MKQRCAAAGQRFLATGEVMWMGDIAAVLRDRPGPDAAKVPTRTIPDAIVRLVALFDPEMRAITPGPGRKSRHTIAKAHQLLAWRPPPAADTVTDRAPRVGNATSSIRDALRRHRRQQELGGAERGL